jgi:hypothetical protein
MERDERTAGRVARWLDEVDFRKREVDFRKGALQSAQDDLDTAVALAKDAGATWDEIGNALGTTRQAAQQRFG